MKIVHFSRLIHDKNFSKDTVKNIRLFVSGSAPLSPAVWEEFKKLTGIPILERYGMTESKFYNSFDNLMGLSIF